MGSHQTLNNKDIVRGDEYIIDEERKACVGIDPRGFYIRHPPTPHLLDAFITKDDDLFQTIHMGGAVVDPSNYSITVDGLVKYPLSLTFEQLKKLPCTTITAFHECYGSPIKPPTENVWRIGNVRWTGVPLVAILEIAQPLSGAKFVWSEGLDFGEFAGVQADRYQKDIPLKKALSEQVLLAYEMNGNPLSRNRGGPVRLVVPGWFGTNMTKWLCKISLQPHRARGPFTTTFYNERDPIDPSGGVRPVWEVEPNSVIVSPALGAKIEQSKVEVRGWAWGHDFIDAVEGTMDDGRTWLPAKVKAPVHFSWQSFMSTLDLKPGNYRIMARATSSSGIQQPMLGHRNHVHAVRFEVLG